MPFALLWFSRRALRQSWVRSVFQRSLGRGRLRYLTSSVSHPNFLSHLNTEVNFKVEFEECLVRLLFSCLSCSSLVAVGPAHRVQAGDAGAEG